MGDVVKSIGQGLGAWVDPANISGHGGIPQDVVNTAVQGAGAWMDPLNISGHGGIPGVNSGGNGLIGSLTGANATDAAKSAQQAGVQSANSALTDSYNRQQGILAPNAQLGNYAMSRLADGHLQDGNQVLQSDPGYQFRLDEGNKAISNAAAARGLGNSGGTLKALTKYGQDYASNEYNNSYNRQYNTLSQLAGYGQNSTNNLANAAGQYGMGIANNYTGGANAQAAAEIAKGNQISNLVGQGAGAAAMFFSDERLKKDLEPISKDDLSEMKKHLKAYAYKYKSEEHGEGQWIGVLAQDLEKSKLGRTLVYEDEDGFKNIDASKVLSLFLATMAEG
jgi:hypothetical protein